MVRIHEFAKSSTLFDVIPWKVIPKNCQSWNTILSCGLGGMFDDQRRGTVSHARAVPTEVCTWRMGERGVGSKPCANSAGWRVCMGSMAHGMGLTCAAGWHTTCQLAPAAERVGHPFEGGQRLGDTPEIFLTQKPDPPQFPPLHCTRLTSPASRAILPMGKAPGRIGKSVLSDWNMEWTWTQSSTL